MANLTITVDSETLKRARIRALERGESVNQYLAERLREYASSGEEHERKVRAAERFVALSREVAGSSHGESWSRADLYADRLGTDAPR
ncbi:hypothetical protein [Flexivirga oryzae]|uniref:Plasmid stability protein n=1 Tax=Flexivirga oryzae TaxID=1794944 RepID=A0A839N1T5_9MICO|nr:hypothetical protein [Flexivirga oryzae]MBB2890759.1 plasmid stability protein [Flexivirga oryzae]